MWKESFDFYSCIVSILDQLLGADVIAIDCGRTTTDVGSPRDKKKN